MKRYKYPLLVILSLILLGAMALGANASTNGKQASSANLAASAGKRVSTTATTPHVINMANVPKETATQAAANKVRQALPFGSGASASVYAQRKAAAAHSKVAATVQPIAAAPKAKSTGPQTPGPVASFAGMSDSAATCPYFGGCEPPDQALAVSFSQVVQAVNTSIDVFNLSGVQQTGFPKNAQNFFGIPNPGACDPNGPFLSDPRAFFDQNFNRFWVEILQVEGSPVGDTCANSSTYWIAVSKNGNATGAWNIYHFDMSLGSGNWADFSEFGFDQQAIYFSGNMFSFTTETYQYAEYFGVRKLAMMNGQAVSAFGFAGPSLGGTLVDTVQPTLGEALQVGGPLAGQFIASEDILFGGGECSAGCSGVLIITMSNPGFNTVTASAIGVATDGYSLPPNADEPGCAGCIATNDTRIDSTPVWQRGMITFTLNTAVNNGTNIVSAIFFGQIVVSLNDDGSISGASVFQQGYLIYAGDQSAFFGAMAADGDGDLFMAFGFSSGTTNPEIAYTARRNTFAPGAFHDPGIILAAGAAPYLGSRWGDYSAISPGWVPFLNEVWFSGQFSNASGDWSTQIGAAKFAAGAS